MTLYLPFYPVRLYLAGFYTYPNRPVLGRYTPTCSTEHLVQAFPAIQFPRPAPSVLLTRTSGIGNFGKDVKKAGGAKLFLVFAPTGSKSDCNLLQSIALVLYTLENQDCNKKDKKY